MVNLLRGGKLGGVLCLSRGAAATAPTSGLVARYRADTNVTGTSSVSAWGDMTANAYDVANAGAGKPSLVTNVINGQPVIRFAVASSQFLSRATTPALAQPFTMIAVGSIASLHVTKWWISGGSFCGLYVMSNNQPRAFAGVAIEHQTTWTTGVFKTHMGIFNGVSGAIYLNNVIGTGHPTNIGGGGQTGWRIGGSSSGTEFMDGDIAEILVYDHSLDATERTQIAAYVASRYGI